MAARKVRGGNGLTTAELGAAGEAVVRQHYERRGYVMLDHNWRYGRIGELDLVFSFDDAHGRTVVFCEVKTRAAATHGLGLESVTPAKVRRLRQLAGVWMSEHSISSTAIRGDVASVVWRDGSGAVEIIEGAF